MVLPHEFVIAVARIPRYVVVNERCADEYVQASHDGPKEETYEVFVIL
jgi:hypothetical protein